MVRYFMAADSVIPQKAEAVGTYEPALIEPPVKEEPKVQENESLEKVEEIENEENVR